MKSPHRIPKYGIRLSILSGAIIFFLFGCSNSPDVPTGVTLPVPTHSNASATLIQQERTLPPPPKENSVPINTPTAQSSITNTDQAEENTKTDKLAEMILQINKDRVQADLRKLTGKEPICYNNECHKISNRSTGSKELDWAKAYIERELSGLNYSVESFNWSRAKYTDKNIIAIKKGETKPNEKIYIVAHLDGKKSLWRKQSPAADDNASGVVDLLELARVIDTYSFNRTVVLFFSTGEEQGTLGVKSYLDQLSPDEISSIKFVINVDMIGYDANGDSVMEIWHGGHSPSMDFAQLFSNTIRAYELNLIPEFVVGCG